MKKLANIIRFYEPQPHSELSIIGIDQVVGPGSSAIVGFLDKMWLNSEAKFIADSLLLGWIGLVHQLLANIKCAHLKEYLSDHCQYERCLKKKLMTHPQA